MLLVRAWQKAAMTDADQRRKRIEAMYAGAPISAPKLVPGGYPVPLLERALQGEEAAFDEMGEFLHKGAVELMRRGGGGCSTTAYVFCRQDVMGGEEQDPLYSTSITIPQAHGSGAVKNALCMLTHAMAMFGEARAVAFVMEAWRVLNDKGGPMPKGSLEFVPGREEVVNVILETASTVRIWHGVITRYSKRGFVVAPFEKWPIDMIPSGRFFGTMHPGYDPVKAATPGDASA